MDTRSLCVLRAVQIVCAYAGKPVKIYMHRSGDHYYVDDVRTGSVAAIGTFTWEDSIHFVFREVEAVLQRLPQCTPTGESARVAPPV